MRHKKVDPRVPVMYDMYVNQKKTLEEVGAHFRITRERVRQLLDRDYKIGKRYTGTMDKSRRSEKIQKRIEFNNRIVILHCKTCGNEIKERAGAHILKAKRGTARKYCSVECRNPEYYKLSPEERIVYRKKQTRASAIRWKNRHPGYFKKLKKNPEHLARQRMWSRVHVMVSQGKLAKPSVCQKCGKVPVTGRIQAHLNDDLDISKIQWWCTRCSALARHAKNK